VPKMLGDACLRQGIFELSKGKPLADVISETTSRFYLTASDPGLDIAPGIDPYKLAMDWVACLETILTTLSRRPMVELFEVPSKPLDKMHEWSFLSFKDKHGELHRTVTVDHYNSDAVTKEMHSWYVFGDVSVAKKPMHLHFIEIGQTRDGRRHTPWCRGFSHIHIANRLKFQNKGAKPLKGDVWQSVWLSESTRWDAAAWCDQLDVDDVPNTLIHEVVIDPPKPDRIAEAIAHIRTESDQMQSWEASIENPSVVPMARAACHWPNDCSYLPICYGPQIDVDIAGLGLYKPRKG